MINDLDETLKQLLIKKGGLDPSEVDISFDIPTRDWSTPVTRPTINLYLYDIHENTLLREMTWDREDLEDGRTQLVRRPRRIDLSYMVTCWTSAVEDQHRLLWRVLETFFRHNPLPDDVLQGDLKNVVHPISTLVSQPDGILKNVSDFWGALENQLRPAISLIATVDLDLDEITTTPLVLAQIVKFGEARSERDEYGRERLAERLKGWEAAPLRLGGLVHDSTGQPVPHAALRLIRTQPDGHAIQVGETIESDANGHYTFSRIPSGDYTLVVEVRGHAPHQRPLSVRVGAPGETLPELVHQVEVTMT